MLLTFDRDHGELIFHRGRPAPPGVVYFRFEPVTGEEPADRLLTLLANPSFVLRTMFTVIEETRERQRPLP